VTASLADQIRSLAAQLGFDVVANPSLDVPLSVRREIKQRLGLPIQNVNKALKQTKAQGAQPAPQDEHHCPACGQALRSHRAHEQLNLFLEKTK